MIIGLDISRGKATACCLNEEPIDLLEFARSYKALEFKAQEPDLTNLAALGDIFVLEPTGSDHRIFVEYLKERGKTVLGCTGIRIRNHAKENGILNKADREDAAVIASYGLRHLRKQNIKGFVSIDAVEIRDRHKTLRALKKQATQLINQLRSRLVYECPEIHATKSGNRQWLSSHPPAIWRSIAGESGIHPSSNTVPATTAGRGISELSRQMAQQICSLERLQCAIECECEATLASPELAAYRDVFATWGINPNTQIAILGAIYPFDQFLDNGRRARKRVYSTEKSHQAKTVRDRSLKQFKRAIGAGRQRHQSGKGEFWMMTGDRRTRGDIYAFLETVVVIRRQPTLKRLTMQYPEASEKLKGAKGKARKKVMNQYTFRAVMERAGASTMPWKDEGAIAAAMKFTGMSHGICRLQLFYEFAPQCQNKGKRERLMKVYPRFCEWLFRDLLSKWQHVDLDRVSCVLREDFLQAVKLLAGEAEASRRSA